MIGSSVRTLYVKGSGFPCFVSVEQDGTGNAHAISLAIARLIGATKTGAIASSAREETAMDLFAEQALWPTIIMAFRFVRYTDYAASYADIDDFSREAFSVLKEAGCSDEALVYEMSVLPLKPVINSILT